MKRKKTKTGNGQMTRKVRVRLIMRNKSWLAHNADRPRIQRLVLHKDTAYYPEHVLAIKNPVTRGEMMEKYDALRSGLKIGAKYKRHHMQREPELLKLSKELGLFPESYTDKSPETKEWEVRWEAARRAKAARSLRAKMARRKKKALPYSQQLAIQLQKDYGIKAPKFRKVRKVVKTVFTSHDPRVTQLTDGETYRVVEVH